MGDDGENIVVTKSEHEILHEFWPYWYEKMCKKFGTEYVAENHSFHDCLEDWIVVNWAWEVKE
jgi:hypothetical protein